MLDYDIKYDDFICMEHESEKKRTEYGKNYDFMRQKAGYFLYKKNKDK